MPPRVVERRPKPRRRVLLSGRVSLSEGVHHFDCTIRDLTDAGARITVAKSQLIPSSVFLINMRDRTVHESKVVWNNGREVGLSFSRSFSLAEIPDPKLLYLKRLCL